MSSTLSLRVETEIIDTLDQWAVESRASRSKLAREALLVGIEEMDGVPDHVAHDAHIRQLISRNKKTRRAGKFRSEFSKQLKSSFENDEHPQEFRQSVSGYIEEAQEMGELPEGVQSETDCETYAEWVDGKLKYYATAYQASNFSHDPVENPLGEHSGLQDPSDWLTAAENAHEARSDGDVKRARRIIRNARQSGIVPEDVSSSIPGDATEAERLDHVFDAAMQLADSTARLTEGNNE